MSALSGNILSRVLETVLTIRVGEPHGTRRGGWKKEVMFDVDDRYAVFRDKCLVRFAALVTSTELGQRRIELQEDSDIYLKLAKNDKQADYMRLSANTFASSLIWRWRLLAPADKANIAAFRFDAFLYVANVVPPPANFHRATQGRVDQARFQRIAHEAANAVQFGPIAAHHLDIVNARRPDNAPFEVPADNTTAQAIELDRHRAALEADVAAHDQQRNRQTATMTVQLNGTWVPVDVDIISMRRAIGLPDHDIFTAGIFHERLPDITPTNPELEDVDHIDSENEHPREEEDPL